MNWIDQLERKFGRFAVTNLTLYLIIGYGFGYLLEVTNSGFYYQYLSLNAERILHGEVWRIFTYLLYPPSTNVFYIVLESLFFFWMGRLLEQLWGTFRFNLYMIIGILGNVLAAIIIYLGWHMVYLLQADQLYMTMILGVALTIPDMEFRLYFAIPIKAKWIGIFYGVLLVLELIAASMPEKVAIVMSLLNVILFYFVIRKPKERIVSARRRQQYQQKVREATPKMATRHRCAVCGRTEEDDPNLEFRYCSRCEGSFEYCQDHLYSHVHVVSDTNEN